MKKYYIGIDGGGSKTSFVLGDENNDEVNYFYGGPTSLDSVSIEIIKNNLYEGIKNILHKDGKVVSLFGGFGGVTSSKDIELMKNVIKDTGLLNEDTLINVNNDIYNAFYSSFDESGITLIVGTGSVTFGRSFDGEELRLGGYGYLEGDYGSGYFISHEALRILAKMYDGVYPFNETFKEFSKLINVNSKEELIKYIMTSKRNEIASTSKFLIDNSSNTFINEILHVGAKEYALLVDTILKKLNNINKEVSIIGSCGNNDKYKNIIEEEILKLHSEIKFKIVTNKPVHGSLVLARKLDK